MTARSVFAVAMLAAVGDVTTGKDVKPQKGEVLRTVVSVTTALEEKAPPTLVVTAVGEVPTGGWTGAKLTPRPYDKPPADGIYEYELTAVRPAGIVTQVMSKVTATHKWSDPPKGLKGVKVLGVGDGAKTAKVGESVGGDK